MKKLEEKLGLENGGFFALVALTIAIVLSVYGISLKKESVRTQDNIVESQALLKPHNYEYSGYKMEVERARVRKESQKLDWLEIKTDVEVIVN